MKRIYNLTLFTLILFVGIFFLLNCKNENKNAEEEFDRETILTYLLLPKYQPIESCKSAYVEAQVCLSESKSFPLLIVNETTLSTVFSSGLANNYIDLCNQSRSSSVFKNYTDQAYACNFNCQSSYWKSLSSNNLTACSEQTFANLWNNSINDTSLRKCLQACFQVTGSTVASGTRLELYLLYSTLQ